MIRRLTHGLRSKTFLSYTGVVRCLDCAYGRVPLLLLFSVRLFMLSVVLVGLLAVLCFLCRSRSLEFLTFPHALQAGNEKRLEFDRAFHVVVCALNFLHADCSFVPLDLMLKEPSDQQQTALRNLRSLLKAFGSSGGSFSVPQSGRRSIHLLAGLSDLSRFMTFHGLSSDPYHPGFAGGGDVQSPDDAAGVGVLVPDQSLAEELTPYRTLCPDRLKITGKANWDPVPFLGDVFAMPFVEPKLLKWTSAYDERDIPDLQRESPDCVLGLARVWDRNGLLSLLPRRVEQEEELSCMRCFNCYKSTCRRLVCQAPPVFSPQEPR